MREGLIPTVLGTAVAATGVVMEGISMQNKGIRKNRNSTVPIVAAGVIGFGLAHVVLGTIDLVQHRYD